MVLFQWYYLTVKCYITLEFPAWAQGRPGPGCFFVFITAEPSPLTLALQRVRYSRKKGRMFPMHAL